MDMHVRRFVTAAGLLLTMGGLLACSQEPPPPTTVENASLGIRLAAVPDGFTVAENAQGTLVLNGPDGGELAITSTDSDPYGVNLVAAVQARQAATEEAGGEFKGSRQLKTPWGPAYTARSRFQGPDGATEEMAVFALNPSDTHRMLTVIYTYPAGDNDATTAHIKRLLDVLAQVDPLAGQPGAGDEGQGS